MALASLEGPLTLKVFLEIREWEVGVFLWFGGRGGKSASILVPKISAKADKKKINLDITSSCHKVSHIEVYQKWFFL